MTDKPKQCPKCGAGADLMWDTFVCGSFFHADKFYEGPDCLRHQRDHWKEKATSKLHEIERFVQVYSQLLAEGIERVPDERVREVAIGYIYELAKHVELMCGAAEAAKETEHD